MFQTEFEFTLPKGYVDGEGNLHRDGRMRLATAADEILPLKDPRVQSNPAYLTLILLSRVVVNLGTLGDEQINPKQMEGLFAEDLSYLQDFYAQVNGDGTAIIKTTCPHCEKGLEIDLGAPEGP